MEAQIEKSEALKSQEDRLMKEYQLTKTGSMNPSKDVPKTVSIGLQTSDELLSKPMKLAVKVIAIRNKCIHSNKCMLTLSYI